MVAAVLVENDRCLTVFGEIVLAGAEGAATVVLPVLLLVPVASLRWNRLGTTLSRRRKRSDKAATPDFLVACCCCDTGTAMINALPVSAIEVEEGAVVAVMLPLFVVDASRGSSDTTDLLLKGAVVAAMR